jgi:plastocyanin
VAGRITDASGAPVKDAVVYIKGGAAAAERGAPPPPVIDQREKTFLPPVLPVVVGTRVDFKNSDPLLHNAYSRSKTKAFDLGAFSSKETRSVVFDMPGRVDVFCAIHTNMHTVILVLDTPHFALTDAEGAFRIAKAPAGKRTLTVWHDLNGEEEVAIDVPEERALVVKRAIAYRAHGAGAGKAP